MKYALLIYAGGAREAWEQLPEDEQRSVLGEYRAVAEAPGVYGAEQLEAGETATTLRVDGGQTLVTDGPFAETKEFFGGYYLLEADNLDDALALAADPVDRPVARRGHQPRPRIVGGALPGPALGGGRESVLGGLLGEVEVAEEADQGRQDASPLVVEDPVDQSATSPSRGEPRRRRPIAPPMRAAGIRAASSMAVSRLSASKKQ